MNSTVQAHIRVCSYHYTVSSESSVCQQMVFNTIIPHNPYKCSQTISEFSDNHLYTLNLVMLNKLDAMSTSN